MDYGVSYLGQYKNSGPSGGSEGETGKRRKKNNINNRQEGQETDEVGLRLKKAKNSASGAHAGECQVANLTGVKHI